MLQLIKIIFICAHGWPGHSQMAVFCLRTSPAWTSACFTYPLLIGLNCLLAPGPSWWLFLSKRQWGVAPLLVSLVTNEPTWHQPPIRWFLALPWSEEVLSRRMVRCCSRTLLQKSECPHPLINVSVSDSRLFLKPWSWASIGLVGLPGAAQQLVWIFSPILSILIVLLQ